MINLLNSNYSDKNRHKKNNSNSNNNNSNSNDKKTHKINNSKLNNEVNTFINFNLEKKSFIKKMKHSAKLKAKNKKYKPLSIENYCKTFHKLDILGNTNKELYKSCKIHKYCRKTKCKNIDEVNAKELKKRFGNNYNMYIQNYLRQNCPLTVSSKNRNKCETKTLKDFYNKYGIGDIYTKLNDCNKVICSKEKKIFYNNLFRTKQIKLKKKQKLLLAKEKQLEEPDMYLIMNGDL